MVEPFRKRRGLYDGLAEIDTALATLAAPPSPRQMPQKGYLKCQSRRNIVAAAFSGSLYPPLPMPCIAEMIFLHAGRRAAGNTHVTARRARVMGSEVFSA
jgi:hypothetical protein